MTLDLEAIRERCERAEGKRARFILDSPTREVPEFIETALLDIPALIEELEKEGLLRWEVVRDGKVMARALTESCAEKIGFGVIPGICETRDREEGK